MGCESGGYAFFPRLRRHGKVDESVLKMEERRTDRDASAMRREKLKKRSGQRTSQRRRMVARGQMLVVLALFLAIAFYVAFLGATLVGDRFAVGDEGRLPVAQMVVGVAGVLAISLAVAAYCTHRAPRYLYLLLNFVGALAGIIWIGARLAVRANDGWLYLDAAGVTTALLVLWVFFYSRNARRFLEEKELTVKRD